MNEVVKMRIISGRAKGKRLKAPSGNNTRPITDMIKESLFNVLGLGVAGSYFLDLFAGSGAVGIEALSRNAALVLFIEKDNNAIRVIKDNLINCGFDKGYEVYRNDVFKALDIIRKRGLYFDYIYIDPPFTNEPIFEETLKALDMAGILAGEGIIIIRTRRKKLLPSKLKNIKKYRVNDYGESTLHYYCLFEEEENDDGNI
ncbi:MAG: 16S rRNA (guanine(966)-N(2))-methyltransferase RsmD [Syntrophomonadaceae bacterium]|nr:16S rRNA (guanine(966)-N(2))-methyltransferase RsmD [Syntrophomonadaceae bacterium]MDD3022671.1 16S rRNA (guanine(966)-N(2))-methyltransferase RsmD [Syntrophomonadaceae bacterium]